MTTARGLLRATRPAPALSWTLMRWAVAIAFVALCAHSSYIALRDEPVWGSESTRELIALDSTTRGHTLLFLGNSDYAPWIFSDSLMSALDPNTVSLGQGVPAPTKSNTYGTGLDFDSISPATVNRFDWVITTNTSYASAPPAGFALVRTMRMYELWRRTATIAPRLTLEQPGQPGAVLNCRTPAGRRLRGRSGVAAVMTAPVITALSGLLPGTSDPVALRLPAGVWSLSLQYLSPVPVQLSAQGHVWRMPAYDDRPGPYFAVGQVRSTGTPIGLTLTAERPSALTGPILAAQLSSLAAVADPATRRLVPLHQACGQYIDWYEVRGVAGGR